MSDIYRPIKVYNGSGFDYIFPSVCRSVTFGITADQMPSNGYVLFNKIFSNGSPEYRDNVSGIASLTSGGNIKINKAGRYLVIFNAELKATGITANPQFQIYCDTKKINVAVGSVGLWADKHKGNICGVMSLDSGDTIKCLSNFLSGGGGTYTFYKNDTHCTLVYLGEK